jgi:hypothetical protein
MPTKPDTELINAAILGYQEQQRHIDTKVAELRAMLSGGSAETATIPEGAPQKRKKRSAAVRRKMAEAQRLRWAKIRGESEPVTKRAPKAKRRISEEGMKRIIAGAKKRWRLARAAKKA